ncbi:MAG: SAM-dependent chlorinase/fluorinase [Phycisphaeraceae bacterium]
MPVITLLTDFGLTDTYVGQMKGVIADIAPDAQVIDLTHDVPAQNITAGAMMLDAAVDAFAPDAIHVAVVDPGVGGGRQAVAVRTSGGTFVGPDNGLFTAVLDRFDIIAAVRPSDPAYHRESVSATFHGRDVFAPGAAHLAAGVALDALGEAVVRAALVRLDLPRPEPTAEGLVLHVVWIDRFGNLLTDLDRESFARWWQQTGGAGSGTIELRVNDTRIVGVARTFSDVAEGEPVAYFGSSGRLEIAVRHGSAASRFNAAPGDVARLIAATNSASDQ